MIYPNPTNDDLSIDYLISENMQNCKVQITNLSGNIVYEIDINESKGLLKFNAGQLISGAYFVNIISNNSTLKSVKFVKK